MKTCIHISLLLGLAYQSANQFVQISLLFRHAMNDFVIEFCIFISSLLHAAGAVVLKSEIGGFIKGLSFVGGRQDGTTAKSGNVDTGAFSLNINRWNAASLHRGTFFVGYVWNRALTDAEIASISVNPWRLFAPRQIIVPYYEAPTGPTVVAVTPTTIGSTSHRPRYTWTPA
jgi:hypothetical protein